MNLDLKHIAKRSLRFAVLGAVPAILFLVVFSFGIAHSDGVSTVIFGALFAPVMGIMTFLQDSALPDSVLIGLCLVAEFAYFFLLIFLSLVVMSFLNRRDDTVL